LAIFCPSAGWHESEQPLPPDYLQDSSPLCQKYVCLCCGAAVVNHPPPQSYGCDVVIERCSIDRVSPFSRWRSHVLHERAGDVHVVASVTLGTCPLDLGTSPLETSPTFSPMAAIERHDSAWIPPSLWRLSRVVYEWTGDVHIVASVTLGTCPLTSDSVPMPSPWPVGTGGMDERATPLLARCHQIVSGASSRATDTPAWAGGSLLAGASSPPLPFRGPPPSVTLDVMAVGAEVYAALLTSAPQVCACPLSVCSVLAREMHITDMVG